ncbi:MAG: DUF2341 domain-containing protein, partial [Chloroflexota bacterium]|nr:DUF2341 domain-containing protein [Chloroflexota bacterium]
FQSVVSQTLISAGKMQSDGDDIRFTQSNGTTEIYYWIESGINTTSTSIWTKAPSIPTGDSTIYIYYGYTDATSASSLSNTFTSGSFTDSFADQTNISSSTNIEVTGGEVILAEGSGQNPLSDDFETDLTKWDGNGTTSWALATDQYHDGSQSVKASDGNEGNLTSDDIDLSDAKTATLDFWFRKDTIDSTDFTLYFYNGSTYDLIDELDDNGADTTWLHYDTVSIDLNTYDISDFRVRFDATLDAGELVWVDQLTVAKTPYETSGDVTSVTIPTDSNTRFAVGNQLSWNDTEPTNTDLIYQLYYYDSTWQLIPDSALSGNSTGFDTSSVSISSVTTDYDQIRIKGSLSTTDTSETPSIQDWTVSYYYRKYTSTEPTTSNGTEEGYYYASGTLASKVYDTYLTGATWTRLSWDEVLASGTDITFEVRASDTVFLKNAASPSWNSVGGTSPVDSSLPSGRYKQWRATLTNTDPAETPTLEEVMILYK